MISWRKGEMLWRGIFYSVVLFDF